VIHLKVIWLASFVNYYSEPCSVLHCGAEQLVNTLILFSVFDYSSATTQHTTSSVNEPLPH